MTSRYNLGSLPYGRHLFLPSCHGVIIITPKPLHNYIPLVANTTLNELLKARNGEVVDTRVSNDIDVKDVDNSPVKIRKPREGCHYEVMVDGYQSKESTERNVRYEE